MVRFTVSAELNEPLRVTVNCPAVGPFSLAAGCVAVMVALGESAFTPVSR